MMSPIVIVIVSTTSLRFHFNNNCLLSMEFQAAAYGRNDRE